MAGQIDRVGTFRGLILESGVGTTRNGFPQFTGRIAAAQKYVDDKAEMEAFGLTEAGWVDWTAYEQDMTGYFVLFGNDKKNEGATTRLDFQFEALNRALGWDGASLSALGAGDWSKKTVMFWVEENEWNGTVSLKITGIDAEDASPTRSLRTMDANALKDLDTKFAAQMPGKKAAAVKPATAPAKPAAAKPPAGKPAASPQVKPAAPAAAPSTSSTTAPAAPTPASPSSKGPPKTKKAAEQPPFVASSGMTMDKAWEHVMAHRGTASDDAVAEKWIDASGAVAPGKDETEITEEQWAKIAAATLQALTGKAAA